MEKGVRYAIIDLGDSKGSRVKLSDDGSWVFAQEQHRTTFAGFIKSHKADIAIGLATSVIGAIIVYHLLKNRNPS